MSEHHKDATPAIAQVLFDQLTPEQQAEVRKEADQRGVSVIELMRRSVDVLIDESGQNRAGKPVVG